MACEDIFPYTRRGLNGCLTRPPAGESCLGEVARGGDVVALRRRSVLFNVSLRGTFQGAYPPTLTMHPRTSTAGFTLMELLVVIAIVGVLAGLITPSLRRGMQSARRVECLNNQRQIGLAFQQFADLHNNRYPMRMPEFLEGGATESNRVAFLVLSDSAFRIAAEELESPRILVCPADAGRSPAESLSGLGTAEISYVVSTNARPGDAQMIVATDRNVTAAAGDGGASGQANRIDYDGRIHEFKGNMLMGDGRVEWAGGLLWQWSPTSVDTDEPDPVGVGVHEPARDAARTNLVRQPGTTVSPADLRGTAPPAVIRQPVNGAVSTNAVESSASSQVSPPSGRMRITLVPVGERAVARSGGWWWLLLVLLALILLASMIRRRRGGYGRLPSHLVEFYTGAAINGEAMMAVLEERGLAAELEMVHPELRDGETDASRPVRILVDQARLEEAERLFAGDDLG